MALFAQGGCYSVAVASAVSDKVACEAGGPCQDGNPPGSRLRRSAAARHRPLRAVPPGRRQVLLRRRSHRSLRLHPTQPRMQGLLLVTRIAAVALLACLTLVGGLRCGRRASRSAARRARPAGELRGEPRPVRPARALRRPGRRVRAGGDRRRARARARRAARAHRLAGARAGSPAAAARLPGVANYLLGRDRRRWRTGVPTYRQVVYRNAWPGVDVALYGAGGRFEYDLRVAPGADPRAARLAFPGARPRIARDGSLRVGPLRQLPPAAYQRRGGRRVAVASRYVRHADGTIGVRVGRHDRRRALVIDPVLAYSTYLGGSGTAEGTAIAVDGAGAAYVVGQTQSTAFPGTGTRRGGSDAFVARLAPNGSALAWSTYLGGGALDQANGVAAGGDGVVVGGWTTSTDFPTQSPAQAANAGAKDAFLLELSPGGALVWSTYLGGAGSDEGTGVALDAAGTATSPGRPTRRTSTSPTRSRARTAAAATRSRRRPPRAGRSSTRRISGAAATTSAPAWPPTATPTSRAAPARPTSPPRRAPCSRPTPAASTRSSRSSTRPALPAYSTYLGGTGYDVAAAIALTPAGAPVVVGSTQSPAYPTTPGAPQAHLDGASDAFVARLTVAGASLAASTYLGGSSVDAAGGVAVDDLGRAVVAGRTLSTDFPTVDPVQAVKGGALDAFVTRLDGLGTGLATSTYLGGNGEDEALGAAVDGDGNVYVAGRTGADFPTAERAAGHAPAADWTPSWPSSPIGSASPPARRGRPRPQLPPTLWRCRPRPRPATAGARDDHHRAPAGRHARPGRPVPLQAAAYLARSTRSGGVTLGCRLDGGAFRPCTSPYTTARLALAEHRFEVRADERQRRRRPDAGRLHVPRHATARGGPPPRVCAGARRRLSRSRHARLGPVRLPGGRLPARGGLPDWTWSVDEHDESYLFNYDVHLQRHEEYAPGRSAYRDRLFCFAPSLSTPVNPKLEVRFDPRRGEYNRRHACHAQAAFGLVDASQEHRERWRCDGLGHAPKPGGDRTTGNGIEQDAHLECIVTVTIQRHVTELADVVSDRAKDRPSLLVYVPQPGTLTVAATSGTRVGSRRGARPARARLGAQSGGGGGRRPGPRCASTARR